MATIGTCSICRGPVTVPDSWLGIYPPTPSCQSCGAVPAEAHGPVIKMAPKQHVRWTADDTVFKTPSSDFGPYGFGPGYESR